VLHDSRTVIINFQETQFAPNIGPNMGSGSRFIQRRRTTKNLQEDKNPYYNWNIGTISCDLTYTNQLLLFLSQEQFFGILCSDN
jgi:hypothetical protein